MQQALHATQIAVRTRQGGGLGGVRFKTHCGKGDKMY
jgi:hypothetical protein